MDHASPIRTRLHTFGQLPIGVFDYWRNYAFDKLRFQANGVIPIRLTYEGDDISPEICWRDARRQNVGNCVHADFDSSCICR